MRSAVRSKNLSPAKMRAKPVGRTPGPLSNELSPAKPGAKTKRGSRGDLSPAVDPAKPNHGSPGVLDGGHIPSETLPNSASVDLPPGQNDCEAHPGPAGGSLDSGQASTEAQRASAAVDLDGGQNRDDTRVRNASVDLDRGQSSSDPQSDAAPVDNLPPATGFAMPTGEPPGADLLGTDQIHPEPQARDVGADLSPGHRVHDAHGRSAGGVLNGDHDADEAHTNVVAESEGNGQPGREPQATTADPSDALLLILADSLNDVEGLRKATANQLSALTRSSEIAGGKGLSEFSKAAVQLGTTLGILEALEGRNKKQRQGVPSVASKQIDEDGSSLILQLGRALRQHPLGPWVKSTVGIGEKQGARLIAAIGNPYWNRAEDRPRRGPAELWAYCGYAPGQKRKKGVQSNWNAEAKMRAFLCAESCIKQTGDAMVGADPSLETRPRSAENDDAIVETRPGTATRRRSPYRDVYDQARANWADRDTSDGHKHAHALRCVAKAILKDLYLAARAVSDSQPATKTPVSVSEDPSAARAICPAQPTPPPPVSANGATHKENT